MTQALRIAVAGLGTVGCGVLKIIQQQGDLLSARGGRPLEVMAVSARDRARSRNVDVSRYDWVDDPVALAARQDVDVIVELMGGTEGPARDLCTAALAAGKHVVTANKALIAVHGLALAEHAEAANVNLGFEAAVAGGIPIVKGLREGLAANRIRRIVGILNGTCNYILTAMHKSGRGFDDILGEAQSMGYAEADPTFDVDGIDAAHKLALLTSLGFGTRLDFDAVSIEGIRHITTDDIRHAESLGYVIKLLAVAKADESGAISQRVHPAMVPAGSDIAAVSGVFNAVMVEGDPIGRVMFEGPGAGEGPTASAVVADILDIARGDRYAPFGVTSPSLTPFRDAAAGEQTASFCLIITVTDRPGVLAEISRIFSDHGISVQSMRQQGRQPDSEVPLVLTTHPAPVQAMENAAALIAELPSVRPHVRRIRIAAM